MTRAFPPLYNITQLILCPKSCKILLMAKLILYQPSHCVIEQYLTNLVVSLFTQLQQLPHGTTMGLTTSPGHSYDTLFVSTDNANLDTTTLIALKYHETP